MNSIRSMLDPKSIALIGATDKPDSIGRAIFENLLMSTDRKVFAVNPNREKVMDIPCYPTVSSIPEPARR